MLLHDQYLRGPLKRRYQLTINERQVKAIS